MDKLKPEQLSEANAQIVLEIDDDAPLGKVIDQKSVLKQFARELNTITDSKEVLYQLDDISEVY